MLVSRRDVLLLLVVSAIWGSSFLFIKLGVDVLEPSVVVLGRLVVGALLLLALVPGHGGLAPLRGQLRPLVVLGAVNNALYFALISSAGASRAILVTYLVPAFALLYGSIFLDEPLTATALAGLALVLGGTTLATGLARAGRR